MRYLDDGKFELTYDQVLDAFEWIMQQPKEHMIPTYSGRAMYGQTCLGFQFNSVSDAWGAVVQADFDGLVNDCGWSKSDKQEFVDAISEPSIDSMGFGMVFYWKKIVVDAETIPEEFWELV